ncbi:hypothetical protein [Kineosporia babensis]|uniref:2-phospho-L-lactate guanylyltransferase n=1 Tax=Kineosporia babensis TaxID=499548 RepID=A0A9X1NHR2_9ACTN|nr:hypothetical protein [Kineosporia babensis]MCD5313744.1 hypothetical protein [Kineosporia babensis]
MQATVYRYDAETGSGSVLTDSGEVLPFGTGALEHSGLRHLRPGQRLSAERQGDEIVRLTLGTIGAAERSAAPENPATS